MEWQIHGVWTLQLSRNGLRGWLEPERSWALSYDADVRLAGGKPWRVFR